MLSIGELSKVSAVTVKGIRYYQELGLLKPVKIDPVTNYRYYDKSSYERLNSILSLKDLGFTLTEIKSIFEKCSSEEDLQEFIYLKLAEVRSKISKLRGMERTLKNLGSETKSHKTLISDKIEEFKINIQIYASVKIDGSYSDIGHGFRKIYKRAGKWVKGSPYAFYYDMGYSERPNFEAVLEISKKVQDSSLKSGSLKEKRAVKLQYKGPYGGQGETYMKLFEYCREQGYEVELPIIEHYLKGPGVIFKGNPQNYITECILLFSPHSKGNS